MTKDKLKDYIFEILNENDSNFKDIFLDDIADTIRLKMQSDEEYLLKLESREESEMKHRKKSYISLVLGIAVLGLFDFDIIEWEDAEIFLKKIQKL